MQDHIAYISLTKNQIHKAGQMKYIAGMVCVVIFSGMLIIPGHTAAFNEANVKK